MTSTKFIVLATLLVKLSAVPSCSGQASLMETEIKRLHGHEQVSAYWEMILAEDQAYRKSERVDSVDCLNIKRTILMLKYHGYPGKEKFGAFINATPGVVFIHKQSLELKQYYFPLYYKAWRDGNLDTWWICNLLEGMYRGRYQKELIGGGQEVQKEQIFLYLNALEINTSQIRYDVRIIDSLYQY